VDTAAREMTSRADSDSRMGRTALGNRTCMRYESQSGASVDRYSSNVHCPRAGTGILPVSTNFHLSLAHHSDPCLGSVGPSRWVPSQAKA
jgi:hypothetical protein